MQYICETHEVNAEILHFIYILSVLFHIHCFGEQKQNNKDCVILQIIVDVTVDVLWAKTR